MRDPASLDVREVLDGVEEAMSLLFDALTESYAALASAEPDAALGAPLALPAYVSPVSLRALATRIEGYGRNTWALRQVEKREAQVKELLHDYRRGAYSTTSVEQWLAMVRTFREAVQGDLNTAMQAPKGWAMIDLAAPGNHRDTLEKPLLTPREVAPQLGVSEKDVRRRIQEGRLGPWRKQGGRWVISRSAFLRYWDQLASDSDQPHPPGGEPGSRAPDRLEHYRLDPGDGAARRPQARRTARPP